MRVWKKGEKESGKGGGSTTAERGKPKGDWAVNELERELCKDKCAYKNNGKTETKKNKRT